MFKLTAKKGNENIEVSFREYWQALTTGIKLQNLNYKVVIKTE